MKPDLNTVGGLMLARGYDGQISRTAETIVDSLVNEGAEALVAAQVVGRLPGSPRCLRLARETDELLGLVVRDPVTYHADSDGNVSFATGRSVPFLRLGYINATPTENVNAGDGVVAIFGAGVFTGLGGTAGGLSATRLLLKSHKWETTTTANASEPGEVSVLTGNSVNYVTY
jgi:hypothetical protein